MDGGTYATSQDGIHWDMRRNYLAYSRNVLWEDGKVRLMGNLDRPFIYFEDGKAMLSVFCYFGWQGGWLYGCNRDLEYGNPVETVNFFARMIKLF